MRALVYVVPLALAIYALIDLSRSTAGERSGLHPAAWVAIIVLLPVIGPVVWILLSRHNRAGPDAGRPRGGPAPGRPSPGIRRPTRRSGPVAPDDDPDFLWRLEQQQRRDRRQRRGTDSQGEPPEDDSPRP